MGFRVLLASTWLVLAVPVQNPEEFPILLAGSLTEGQQKFSTGNTLPLVGRPWGFNHFSPQTSDGKTSWWFMGNSHEFRWLRLTHQPSPWIGDWGWVLFGPQMGARVEEPVMFWNPWGARMKPHLFDATLGPDNTRVRLTPTDHGAVLKVDFPEHNPSHHPKRICFKLPLPDKGKGVANKSPGRMGRSNDEAMWMELVSMRANDVPRNFGLNFRAQVDTQSLKYLSQVPSHMRSSKSATMHCFEFSPEETAVTVWMSTSLISAEIAEASLNREALNRPFEEVEEESRQVWRELLGRVEVVDPGPMTAEVSQRLAIFYTSLYRALCFPRRLDELDLNGRKVHYSPYDQNGGTFDGILVTDNGFWDTFRTVYPLLALAYPTEAGDIVSGWLNAFKEGGWLPEWSSPGYRQCMVGTFADVVVADAILKDLPGFDRELAWQAILKDSYTAGGKKGQGGKLNYGEYFSRGYIPSEIGDSVSGTLDFAFSDFSVSLAASKLNRLKEADELHRRALAARDHLFDRSSGLMRPKGRAGFFVNADPVRWGSGYTEGSAWHHSFPAFDLQGLAALHGSRENLAKKIEQLTKTPGTFLPGTYKRPIHEMEEMRALALGQYAHNNQPVHHILFLLPGLDERQPQCTNAARSQQSKVEGTFCPRLFSEERVHHVLSTSYGLEFYGGDEDNGEMGAWYVLASIGLFEPAPGTHHGYALGSPVFRHVNIHRKKRAQESEPPSLSIISRLSGTKEVRHVTGVYLDKKEVGLAATDAHHGWVISHEDLWAMPGAVLRFLTGAEDLDQPAPAVAQPGPNNNHDDLVQQIQRQRQVIAQQELALRQAQAAARPPQMIAAPQMNAEAQQMQTEVRQQKEHIIQLENQLRLHAEERRHWHVQNKVEAEVNSGLTSYIYVVFSILVVANGFGWFVFIHQRGPGKKSRHSIRQSVRTSGRKDRAKYEGSEV
jgi:predicted alpha-1,2-mannosidase